MLGMNFMQIGRVWMLRNEYQLAFKMYSKSEGYLMRMPGQSEHLMAHLYYAYGNLATRRKNLREAFSYYEKCKDICHKLYPLHPLAASAWYKMGCTELENRHAEKALEYLDKALNIAEIRNPGKLDGGKARVMWKKGEVLSDDTFRRKEGLELKNKVENEYATLAEKAGLRIDPEHQNTDEAFDLLVPGYFR